MASPGKVGSESANVKPKIPELDKSLDVTSPDFDPLEALYAGNESVPYPNVQVFSNLNEYERKMSQNPEKKSSVPSSSSKVQFRREGAAPLGMKTEPLLESRSRKRESPIKQQNILTRMEKDDLKGPLNLLQKSVQEKHYVRVWTRSAVCIRGVCKGYIIAFDKHFNLAMVDVDEVYRNPQLNKKQRRKLKGNTSQKIVADISTETERGIPKTESTSSSKDIGNSPLLCESVWLGIHPSLLLYRHVNQLFVRGDNVVSINIIQR